MTDSTEVADPARALQHYADLLQRYNDRINLISRQDIGRLWERHINDALSLAPLLQTGSVLDVGSGGGLPGMVLAITDTVRPRRNYCLLERSQRKANFLRRVVAELELSWVRVLCEDMDEGPGERACFANICARAVAPPADLWPRLQPWLAPGGQMLIAYGPRTRDQVPRDAVLEWLPSQTGPEAGLESGIETGIVRLRRA